MGHDLMSELVEAARTRIQTQGEFGSEDVGNVVDEVIDEFTRDGLIDDDENVEALKAELIGRLKSE